MTFNIETNISQLIQFILLALSTLIVFMHNGGDWPDDTAILVHNLIINGT